METNQLKKFATEARTILKLGVVNKLAALGFDSDGHVQDADKPQRVENGTIFQGRVLSGEAFYYKWMALYHRIEVKGIREVYEEAAYTWFNRLVAIRILEKNNLIAPVLTFDNDQSRIPQIVAEARRGAFPPLSAAQRDELSRLLADDMRTGEQFQLLITAYCETNPILSACFGDITDYTEILLPNNITAANGFLDLLNHTDFIKEEDYAKSELIGWLYQFYISEKKDEVFASFSNGKKAAAEDIPAATQIFTPNWIVRYMVENTLGRIYLDKNPDSYLAQDMTYLVEPSQPTPAEAQFHFSSLSELTCADLSCGSGHILNEFFNLLLKMYMEEGYLPQQAVEEIFAHNIVGIDLDTRAKQLSTFSLLLKACQLDPAFCDAHCMPNVMDMPESWKDKNELGRALNDYFRGEETPEKREQLLHAFTLLEQADNLGSIMQFDINERTRYMMVQATQYWLRQPSRPALVDKLLPSIKLILALTDKYAAICMNPPYMKSRNMNDPLSKYVQRCFENGKADLFAVFMMQAERLLRDNGKYGMINMQSWMFLSYFENLRIDLLHSLHIDSMLHLGSHTFDEMGGEVLQNTAYVVTNYYDRDWEGCYYRLVDGKSCSEKELLFLNYPSSPYMVAQHKYEPIPGQPVGYWASQNILDIFENYGDIKELGLPRAGITTSSNERFVRNWYEVDNNKVELHATSISDAHSRETKKWFAYNKGGKRRRWYGNQEAVLAFDKENYELLANLGNHLPSRQFYFKDMISWGLIGGGSYRYYPEGFLFDTGGMSYFPNHEEDLLSTLAFLNSKVPSALLEIINPTINKQSGDIGILPHVPFNTAEINQGANSCISISREDWDAHETSWNFEANPLVALRNRFIEEGDPQTSFELAAFVNEFKLRWEDRFRQLHANEEELNRQFISIYGLESELTPEVPLEDITILQQGEISIESNQIIWHDDVLVKQLLSYLVGIIMGRYRLDRPGLHIAHPEPSSDELAAYTYAGKTIEIDDDAIIPLLPDDAPFPDNASRRIAALLATVFGDQKLIENINFINQALGETLETYIQKHFYAFHTKMYSKCPVYWLFASKKGAFQCLAYMHRMNKFTADQIRTKYLLPYIDFLENSILSLEQSFSELTTNERKRLDRYRKDLEECQEYHDALHDIANRMIELNLDDGVVNNYARFESVLAKLK